MAIPDFSQHWMMQAQQKLCPRSRVTGSLKYSRQTGQEASCWSLPTGFFLAITPSVESWTQPRGTGVTTAAECRVGSALQSLSPQGLTCALSPPLIYHLPMTLWQFHNPPFGIQCQGGISALSPILTSLPSPQQGGETGPWTPPPACCHSST